MRRKLIFVVVLVLVLFLAACQAGGEPEPVAPPASPQSPEEQVLVLWTHEYSTFTAGLRDKWIPEFEAAHPGVRVEYQTFPYSGSMVSFDTKLLAEVSGGGGPDVWAMASHNMLQTKYIQAGLLAPLDPAIFGYQSVDEIVADYPHNSLSAFILDGKIYALPNEVTTLCLFYNQDVFDQAGIPYLPQDKPASWEQIGEISQQLLVSDPAGGAPTRMGYQFGFFASYPSPEWYIQDFYPVMRQYGQDELFVKGEPAGNSAEMVQAFQLFYDFTHTYRAYDPYFITDWFADFANGKVGMVTAGPWYPSAILGINPDLHFGVAPHPVVDVDDTATYQNVMYSFGWVVNANRSSEQQQLAQEFLAFILGKKGESDQHLWWLEHVGLIQPSQALLDSPGYQEVLAKDPWMNCFNQTFETYQVEYYQHSSDEAGAALVRAMNRVVYDQMAPAETARLLQNELLLLP